MTVRGRFGAGRRAGGTVPAGRSNSAAMWLVAGGLVLAAAVTVGILVGRLASDPPPAQVPRVAPAATAPTPGPVLAPETDPAIRELLVERAILVEGMALRERAVKAWQAEVARAEAAVAAEERAGRFNAADKHRQEARGTQALITEAAETIEKARVRISQIDVEVRIRRGVTTR